MKKFIVIAALLASTSAYAQSPICPVNSTNCTVSVQDAGHDETTSTATNTKTTSSQAGVSSASNQSGNNINPNFDNSAQTTQNATTTTGAVNSNAIGNQSDNKSQASNGNQSLSNSGNSASSVGNLSTGPSTSDAKVGNVTSGPSTSSSNTDVKVGPVTGTNKIGDIGGNDQATHVSNGSDSKSASNSGGNKVIGGAQTSDASNSGGNSAVHVDASDKSSNSYSSKAIFIPPVVPPTLPSSIGVGNIIKETLSCGPQVTKVRTPVTGAYMGLFKTSKIDQGWTEDLIDSDIPWFDVPLTDGRIGYTRYGSQVTLFTTILGLGGSRNIAIGGGGGNGSWGQGGGGSSSSTQRIVTTIQIRRCEIGTYVQPAPVYEFDGERG